MIRKILLAAALPLLCAVADAQQLLVFHVGGDVTATVAGKSKVLKVKDKITLQTVVSIPYEGSLDLVDEHNSKRYLLRKVGKGTVATLSSEKGNTVGALTVRYLSYVKKQMTNEGLVSAQRYSDFATVTREVKKMTMREKFELEKKNNRLKFDAFREQCNKQYTDFVRQAWAAYKGEEPLAKPADEAVKPVMFSEADQTNKLKLFGWIKKTFNTVKEKVNNVKDKVVNKLKGDGQNEQSAQDAQDSNVVLASDECNPDTIAKNRPKPIAEIKEVTIPAAEKDFAYMPFTYLGKEMKVRLDETKRVNMGKISPDRVADVLKKFSTREYDNLLHDCLDLRSEHKLCDWAYLHMLKTICDQFCGQGTNEATALLGYLFYQSGYMCRFAHDGQQLYLLYGTNHRVYGSSYFKLDGVNFYPLEKIPEQVYICSATFPGEKYLSLMIPESQDLYDDASDNRNVESIRFSDFSVNYTSNKELINFYNTYPSSYVGDNFMTRWAIYANTPISETIKQQLYPQLKARIEGLSDEEACNVLLSLFGDTTGPGFNYGYDDQIWGGDRPFFAEETLFYPYCDCEDRAVLFTRFVRDLLGLKCVLVYYPGHLACAVHFDHDVQGDTYILDGVPYVVADPTYVGAGLGNEMPLKDNSTTLILLQ